MSAFFLYSGIAYTLWKGVRFTLKISDENRILQDWKEHDVDRVFALKMQKLTREKIGQHKKRVRNYFFAFVTASIATIIISNFS